MPQKRNPDVPELARGKVGRVTGHLVALLTLMKAQPLAYNKDNQEDKEPLFDTVDTVVDTLRAFSEMLPGVEVDADAMRRAAEEGYSTATDLADYLVRKGVPFRDAHEAVARAVKGSGEPQCRAFATVADGTAEVFIVRSATTYSMRYLSTLRWQHATIQAVPHRSECTHRSRCGGSDLRIDFASLHRRVQCQPRTRKTTRPTTADRR